jgi:3-oxoacyl-[acyl-carrier-protein] synthase-3
MPMRSRITGLGFHVPERVVSNHELAKLMDTSDEWIVARTGIHERGFVEPGAGTTELADDGSGVLAWSLHGDGEHAREL